MVTMTKTQAIKKGKEYLKKIQKLEEEVKHYWLMIAELAYKICNNDEENPYSFKDFAGDIGCCKFTLANNVKVYRNAYIKSDLTNNGKKRPDKLTKKQINAIRKAGLVHKQEATKEDIDGFIHDYMNSTPESKRITSFNEHLVNYRMFLATTDLSKTDETILSEAKMHCKKIINELNKIEKIKAVNKEIIKDEWLPVEDIPGYEFNPEKKKIRSLKTNRVMKESRAGQYELYSPTSTKKGSMEKVSINKIIRNHVTTQKKELLQVA
jgi:hypothetical protein